MHKKKSLTVLFILALGLILTDCKQIDSHQESDEWTVLFNGKDLDGWTPKFFHHELGDNYANTFRVVDSVIQVNYDEYDEFGTRYGHLFYEKPFSHFQLRWKYRFTDQWMEDAPSYTYRNSGVMFHSQDPATILKEQDWPISVEYQMLAEAEEGKPRPTGNMCSPGTEVFMTDTMTTMHCVSSSSDTYKWDDWVTADLIVYGDSLVIHQVNGEEVLRYFKPQIGGGVANGYNPDIKIDGQPLTSGYIGLQAEGQGVEFKEIMIKELK